MTYPTQSANSLVFGTVADSRMILTCSGNMIMTSSHTTPRWFISFFARNEEINSSPRSHWHNGPRQRWRIRHLGSNQLPCRAYFSESRLSSAHQLFSNCQESIAHNQTTSFGIDLNISSQNTNGRRIESSFEISEFLIRKRLDRWCVDCPIRSACHT